MTVEKSKVQQSIIDYVNERFGGLGLVVTSTTRKGSKTNHSPSVQTAVDFGFGRFSLLSQKKRLEILSSVFRTMYLEKPFQPLGMGLGLGIVPGNLHLHIDLRDKSANFFETKSGIIGERSNPVKFNQIYSTLPFISVPDNSINVFTIFVIPLFLAGAFILKKISSEEE